MSEERKPNDNLAKNQGTSPLTVILAVLLVIAIGMIAWLLIQDGIDKPPDNLQPKQTEPV